MPRLRRACRRVASFALGLFVLWQLLFLFGDNVSKFLLNEREAFPALGRAAPEFAGGKGVAYGAVEQASEVGSRWLELTNQAQTWSLFAPNIWQDIPFVAVEFRWDEASGLPPVFLLSDNEPADPGCYLRLGKFRVRRYESNIDVNLLHGLADPTEQPKDDWYFAFRNKVRREWRAMHAYLKWRWEAHHAVHPELPEPEQVVLHVRVYRVPPPPGPEPWAWAGPFCSPVARWRPQRPPDARYLPVELYDPRAERFDLLEP